MGGFIPTNSSSPKCLVTLSESPNFAIAGTTVYCGTRNRGGVNGIVVHLFLPFNAPPDVQIFLTVYQQDAQSYGAPVFDTGGA
jgi:hypothetical protein